MFTGTLSRLTDGEALLEMMALMRYDAMGVGNHEFDYGAAVFEKGITRVPFPILCCNIWHKGRGIRYTRPYTILERHGVRLGVIGVMGTLAATRTIMPSKVSALEFGDPVVETAACVKALRDTVDVIVVLAHQGLPGPMQTDAENDPDVQRPIDEDLAFCAAVPGIDVYIAAHSHHGLEQALVHPDTRTLITQTYGYGTRLGRIRLSVKDRKVVRHDIELLKVWSDKLTPDPLVAVARESLPATRGRSDRCAVRTCVAAGDAQVSSRSPTLGSLVVGRDADPHRRGRRADERRRPACRSSRGPSRSRARARRASVPERRRDARARRRRTEAPCSSRASRSKPAWCRSPA